MDLGGSFWMLVRIRRGTDKREGDKKARGGVDHEISVTRIERLSRRSGSSLSLGLCNLINLDPNNVAHLPNSRPSYQRRFSSLSFLEMSDQVFRRVGRGGAGNWYSEKDVKEAEKALAAAVVRPPSLPLPRISLSAQLTHISQPRRTSRPKNTPTRPLAHRTAPLTPVPVAEVPATSRKRTLRPPASRLSAPRSSAHAPPWPLRALASRGRRR
jgi:hypothetical protein